MNFKLNYAQKQAIDAVAQGRVVQLIKFVPNGTAFVHVHTSTGKDVYRLPACGSVAEFVRTV